MTKEEFARIRPRLTNKIKATYTEFRSCGVKETVPRIYQIYPYSDGLSDPNSNSVILQCLPFPTDTTLLNTPALVFDGTLCKYGTIDLLFVNHGSRPINFTVIGDFPTEWL